MLANTYDPNHCPNVKVAPIQNFLSHRPTYKPIKLFIECIRPWRQFVRIMCPCSHNVTQNVYFYNKRTLSIFAALEIRLVVVFLMKKSFLCRFAHEIADLLLLFPRVRPTASHRELQIKKMSAERVRLFRRSTSPPSSILYCAIASYIHQPVFGSVTQCPIPSPLELIFT